MRIVISGASGHFGSAATELLLDRISPSDLILVTRKPDQLARFADSGVAVRYGDFDDTGALEKAFTGGDTLLLISGVKVGHRIPQHTRAIEAARAAGIGRIVYTSYLGTGPENTALVNKDHYGTEQVLMRSGTDWTILHDGFYAESMLDVAAPQALRTGRWVSAAGEGRVSFVDRLDCVRAAVEALTGTGHENRVYEVTGEELWSFREVCELVSELAGTPIEWVPVTDEGLYAHFDALGVPREPLTEFNVGGYIFCSDDMVSFEHEMRRGRYEITAKHIRQLTGRPPRTFRELAADRRGLYLKVAAEAAG